MPLKIGRKIALMNRAVDVSPALCLDAYSIFLDSGVVCSGGCWVGDGLIIRLTSQLSGWRRCYLYLVDVIFIYM